MIILKWYNEELTSELREALEKEIIGWYKVTFKKMFWCPCYLANGKMFAGLITKAVVITKLTEFEIIEIKKLHETKPFNVGGKTLKKWVCLPLDPIDLKSILPLIVKSYERALNKK